jgi:hypothetical protein
MATINWKDAVQQARESKLAELDQTCNRTILGNFAYTYSDGNTYYFNNDTMAQGNFDKVLNAFDKNLVTAIAWTAYTKEGAVARLVFDVNSYLGLYEAHLNHIQANISKFRDFLEPKVMAASTVPAIQEINWNYQETLTDNVVVEDKGLTVS